MKSIIAACIILLICQGELFAQNTERTEAFYCYQFEDMANKPSQYVVNNSKGGDIKHPSRTVIHVPAYCVLTPDGKPVVGSYTLLKEYLKL